MRKMLFVIIAVMLVSPAWAAVKIVAIPDRDPANVNNPPVPGSGVVAIRYQGLNSERARAFALDIIVDNGVITEIGNYKRGTDNGGYGIFPGNFSRYITVLDTGEVENWDVNSYTPVADPNDPGALTGLNTSGITIEMGSLYENSANAPNPESANGVLLCTIKCSQTCLLTITTNETRGGVVLEDASVADVNLADATDVNVEVGSGSGTNETYTGSHPEQWIAVGQPACWLSSVNPRQCHGDADGLAQGKQQFWVSTNDLDILIAAWNKPLSSLSGNQICADFDHLAQGKQQFRVSTNDLDILIANWNKAGIPAPDCP
jgi:hypothetical protein